ncbi:MAG: hypothetical protein H5T97_10545, partial [Firmicutes bacterium]|nr:hypothetical protein [Bacillota bacterium]
MFGPGNAVAKVSAELNFDRQTIEKDIFEPAGVGEVAPPAGGEGTAPAPGAGETQPPAQRERAGGAAGAAGPAAPVGVVRSVQETEETYRGTGLPQSAGGPGVEAERGIPGYQAVESGAGNSDYRRREVTRNYEVSKATERTLVAPGSVKRLTVAVVVNRQLEPAMAAAVRNIVAAAIGADPGRQDQISVEGIPFDTSLADSLRKEMESALARPWWLGPAGAWIAVASALGLTLLVLFVRRIRSRKMAPAALREAAAEARGGFPAPSAPQLAAAAAPTAESIEELELKRRSA